LDDGGKPFSIRLAADKASQSGGSMRSPKRLTSIARWTGAAVLLAITLGPTMALSQQPAPQSAPAAAVAPGSQLLLSRVQPEQTLDQYLENLRNDFFQIDADSDGKLTQQDVELHALMETIQFRMMALGFVTRFDLDGDGAVTEDEIRKVARYEMRTQLGLAAFKPPVPADALEKQIESTVRSIMALDADKDGKVVYSEAAKFTQPGMQRGFEQNGPSARARQALTLNTESKGAITLADYQGAGEALFRKIDSDHDGKISQQELVDYRRQPDAPDAAALSTAADAARKRLNLEAEAGRRKLEAAKAARAVCALPAPSPKAKVILLSAYKTEALSSVAIGPQEAVVHAGRIVVEPGDDPLYVVISTYAAMIWQFSGATGRIERLVMGSSVGGDTANPDARGRVSLVGATGIPEDKISFFAKLGCLNSFSEMPSSQSVRAVADVREATGQEPFRVFTASSVLGFRIPSGKVESVANVYRQMLVEKGVGSLRLEGNIGNMILRAGRSQALDDLYLYSPGGLVEIDPKSVVSSLPAQTYEVFPEQAGLVQLLESGALKLNRSGEYIVQKKIRFPAGLDGAHSVKFLVLRGTPLPDGHPGHSCVTVEDQTLGSKFEPCR
jgi:Ca2+-binding EF-hand superfamily protein